MKVELIKQTFDNHISYKYKPFKWCCHKSEINPLMHLVYEYPECTEHEEESGMPEVCVSLCYSEIVHDWEDEWQNDYYYKMAYCPFCGEPIEISIVAEEDVSKVVSELEKEREQMWKKYNKTDSKKKSEELRKIVYDLDDKINYFYELAEYRNLKNL